jgi:hypothetical protein
MLDMEYVGGVMRAKMMLDRSHKAGRFIAGRWDHLTVEPRKRALHQRIPGVLITTLGRLFQDEVVAFGLE